MRPTFRQVLEGAKPAMSASARRAAVQRSTTALPSPLSPLGKRKRENGASASRKMARPSAMPSVDERPAWVKAFAEGIFPWPKPEVTEAPLVKEQKPESAVLQALSVERKRKRDADAAEQYPLPTDEQWDRSLTKVGVKEYPALKRVRSAHRDGGQRREKRRRKLVPSVLSHTWASSALDKYPHPACYVKDLPAYPLPNELVAEDKLPTPQAVLAKLQAAILPEAMATHAADSVIAEKLVPSAKPRYSMPREVRPKHERVFDDGRRWAILYQRETVFFWEMVNIAKNIDEKLSSPIVGPTAMLAIHSGWTQMETAMRLPVGTFSRDAGSTKEAILAASLDG